MGETLIILTTILWNLKLMENKIEFILNHLLPTYLEICKLL